MISNEVRQAILSAKNYPYIIKIGVFGSYARGDFRSESDLDILIDYDNSSDQFMNDIGNFMEDLELAFTGRVDYVTMPGLINSKDENLKNEVLQDVKWIYTS